MKIEEIKEIAETWFEWDTDRRDYITYTSAMLFARDMYERAQAAERERIRNRVKEAADWLRTEHNRDLIDELVNRILGEE